MTKSEFIAAVAADCGQTDVVAKAVLGSVGRVLNKALTTGDEASIHGVGKFTAVQRGESRRRNPATGEPVLVPLHKVVKYKPQSDLKEAVSKA